MIFALIANAALAFDFQCQKLIEDNENYLHCSNRIAYYSLPFHFFYPKNLDANKSVTINLHFHGHNLNGYDHFYKTKNPGEGYGDFGSFLVQSKLNGIFIVPESYGNCATYDNEFKSEANAVAILNELIELNPASEVKLSLSGHSGAYRVLKTIFSIQDLENKISTQIIGIGLFDATYSTIDSILNFKENNSDFIFFDSYVDGAKGTTDDISNQLKSKYNSKENFYFYPVPSTDESVLDQHFKLLQRKGIRDYLMIL